MLTLYSYPGLFGVADNNPFGLKVYAFLKLCGLAFRHEHIFDASTAPRGQLPYLVDGDKAIGDSDTIIGHLISRNALTIDHALTPVQRDTDFLVRRMLDDLYWVMSYSRWKDDRYWPLFQDAILQTHPDVMVESLEMAREYNFKRYHFQGIGRYAPDAAYARGIADLQFWRTYCRRADFCLVRTKQHRCRDLWIYRQYLLLRHRHAAARVSRFPVERRPALPIDSRRYGGMSHQTCCYRF